MDTLPTHSDSAGHLAVDIDPQPKPSESGTDILSIPMTSKRDTLKRLDTEDVGFLRVSNARFRSAVKKVIAINQVAHLSRKYIPSEFAYHWTPGGEQGVDISRLGARFASISCECDITLVDYSTERIKVRRDITNHTLESFLTSPRPPWSQARWINVNGLSWDVIRDLAMCYDLHPLAVEDVFHIPQRTKVDYYATSTFISLVLHTLTNGPPPNISKSMEQQGHYKSFFDDAFPKSPVSAAFSHHTSTTNGSRRIKTAIENTFKTRRSLDTQHAGAYAGHSSMHYQAKLAYRRDVVHVGLEQVYLFLVSKGKHANTLITIFEHCGNPVTEPIHTRLQEPRTLLRTTSDVSMLMQALIDAIVDHALPIVEQYREQIETLETKVLVQPQMKYTKELHLISGELVLLKRTLAPLQGLVHALRDHDDDGLVSGMTRTYLADVLDHITTTVEDLDTMGSISENLINLIFNVISYETNESMKIFTWITVLFLPISFLAGVFGMNFEEFPLLKNHSSSLFWYMCLACVLGVTGIFCYTYIKRFLVRLYKQWRRRVLFSGLLLGGLVQALVPVPPRTKFTSVLIGNRTWIMGNATGSSDIWFLDGGTTWNTSSPNYSPVTILNTPIVKNAVALAGGPSQEDIFLWGDGLNFTFFDTTIPNITRGFTSPNVSNPPISIPTSVAGVSSDDEDILYFFSGDQWTMYILDTSNIQSQPLAWATQQPTDVGPNPRYGMAATLLEVYGISIITGGTNDGTSAYSMDTVDIFRTLSGYWDQPQMTSGDSVSGRFGHTATASYDDKLIVFGGIPSIAPGSSVPDQIAVLDPSNWSWTIKNPVSNGADVPPPDLYGHQAVMLGTNLVIMFGQDTHGNVYNTTYVIDTNAEPWTYVNTYVPTNLDNPNEQLTGNTSTGPSASNPGSDPNASSSANVLENQTSITVIGVCLAVALAILVILGLRCGRQRRRQVRTIIVNERSISSRHASDTDSALSIIMIDGQEARIIRHRARDPDWEMEHLPAYDHDAPPKYANEMRRIQEEEEMPSTDASEMSQDLSDQPMPMPSTMRSLEVEQQAHGEQADTHVHTPEH